MRELKLKYIIQLLSDIGEKSNRDAKTLEEAQKRVQKALGDTENKVGLVERALLRMGGVGGQSASRQADYLSKLALRYHDVRKAAEGAVGAMQRAAQVGAGVAAGAYAVDRMTQAPMEYSARLAQMANTAYSDRNVAGRIAGKQTLNAAITAAVRVGGGTRDDAAGTLDKLLARNAMSPEAAVRMLPLLMKSSTASGATGEQLASIALAGMQNFGIREDQVGELLNMSVAAGQAGGFELKDMARHLPELMAVGSTIGLSGTEGARRLLASLQASIITSGTPDAAANNTLNLLGKIAAPDTQNDFKKIGIDLPKALADANARGTNSMDAFVGLVDQIVQKDPRWAAANAQLLKEGNAGVETRNTQAVRDIFQGAGIGKVVQDRQALIGLLAEMNQRKTVNDVMDATRRNTGAVDTNFAVMSEETSFKRQQALAEATNASQVAFDKLAPTLNKVFDAATNLEREFPVLTAAVMLTAGTLTAIAAALGGAGLAGLAMGGGGAAGTGRALAGRVAGAAAVALPWLGVAGAGGFAGYEMWRLGSAASDWYGATHREGVKLTPWAQARLNGGPLPAGPDLGVGNVTGMGMQGLGEGRLAVDVRVSDERTTATTTVTKPLPIVRIDAGATNPAGYAR